MKERSYLVFTRIRGDKNAGLFAIDVYARNKKEASQTVRTELPFNMVVDHVIRL